MSDAPLLEVKELVTRFRTDEGELRAVDGVSFSVPPASTVGLVGESGSGKSVTALSILRLVRDPPGRIVGGEINFRGRDLLRLPEAEMRALRGDALAMIFQEPMTSLNPVLRIGDQVGEPLVLHRGRRRRAARAEAVELLRLVGIADPERRALEYPHQLSGGMRQRAMIAMALACRPTLLIADEPTTALDVTIQAQILALLADLQRELGMAMLLITHDLGVVAEVCDEVVVMYAGHVVEQAPVAALFARPRHPYTVGLLRSIPPFSSLASTPPGEPGAAPMVSAGDPHRPRPRLPEIPGVVPRLDRLPPGCRFQDRCPLADDRCRREEPQLQALDPGSLVRCFHPVEDPAATWPAQEAS